MKIRKSSDRDSPHPPPPFPAQISSDGKFFDILILIVTPSFFIHLAIFLLIHLRLPSSADPVFLDAALKRHALGNPVFRCSSGGVRSVGVFVHGSGLTGAYYYIAD